MRGQRNKAKIDGMCGLCSSVGVVTGKARHVEAAFEVVSPSRTWTLCPDDEETMRLWMGDIVPLLGKSPRAINRGGGTLNSSIGFKRISNQIGSVSAER